MSDSELIRDVLSAMPDGTAADIAAEVERRYGVTVTAVNVRAVRSRASRGMNPGRSAPGRPPGNRVRAKARVVTVPRIEPDYDDDDGYSDDDDSGYTPPPRPVNPPRTPVRPIQPPRPVSQPATADDGQGEDYELYELIDRVEAAVRQATAGHIQQVTGDRDLIGMISEICDEPELRANNKPFRYEVLTNLDGTQTLRLYADNPVRIRPESRRRGRKEREPGCEFCRQSGRPDVPGVSLYLTHGGALGQRQRILCVMHAEPEVRAGATATPYRVYSEIYSRGAVIVPPKTPMQQLRERIMQSSGYASGYPG